ncbi:MULTISPECIES: nucleotide sugar dehydrogenase [Nocardioides]|uniref:UDP-glucose 6-dehydrogenase n=1 Tax=Nocardioides vastitatis TaxID=2568655 RepID=A0ABW0ZHJ4_9ACTN|nr:nucleotide sugar dehydrogenase [Nocardioides sp.]THI96655.1 UDP-glucose/GDP-mannose dehydrogenase family protein [Nocardioides sp.]
MKVAVFGLGYVGTVTSAGLARCGHDVVGVDVDESKVRTLNEGRSPVVEPGLDELVAHGVANRRLWATTSVAVAMKQADLSLICVGTPSGQHGRTELCYLDRVLADIREAMRSAAPPRGGHHSVVVRSTVPPGTGADRVAPVFADDVPGWSVGTAMVPEFLREGCAVRDFFAPPYVVVGTGDARTRAQVEELFAFLADHAPDGGTVDFHQVSVPTAEALKYACNAFHATKVSFANELARVFRGYGVDSREVMKVFCADHKLNIAASYLRPGFAYGGSCLPKDVRSLQYLARATGVDTPLLAGAVLTNDLVVQDVVERVVGTDARTVALLGLSFKPDTDDLRESPYVEVAERLLGKGFDVRIWDPIINPERLVGANRRHVQRRLPHLDRILSATPEEALDGAGLALVSSTDPEAQSALLAAPPPHVIDLVGRLGAEVEQLAGYAGVGW